MLRRLAILALVSAVCVNVALAANPFDEFTNKITNAATATAQEYLDSFAKDLGGLLGGGTFHQGKALGVPGFDVGIHAAAKTVSEDNVIIKDADLDTVMLPILQAEVGLPAKIDLIARYTSFNESTLAGLGVRYGLLKKSLPGFPSVSVQAVYTTLDVQSGLNKFKANTMSLGVAASFNLPIITPYIGGGIDSTNVEPDAALVLPEAGMKGTASGYRLEGGINMSLVPFTYVQLGGAYINGDTGYTAGLGIKF